MVDAEVLEEWMKHGHRCKVVKVTLESGRQHYCGYVRTPLRVGYEKLSFVDIHGGLTSGVDEDGWVGFDCAHSGDLCLDEDGEPMADGVSKGEYYTEWSLEDVKEETEDLAHQMTMVEKFVEAVR